MADETREAREKRLAAEYEAYTVQCERRGFGPVNFVNWSVSEKFKAKVARGERAFDRREVFVTREEREARGLPERRKVEFVRRER